MKVAFPLLNENELAIDFAHSKFIGVFDDTLNENIQLIPLFDIEKELGIVNFFDIMVTFGLNTVVSPYYSYMALRVFKENNIETYKAQGNNLNKNINFFHTRQLELFNVSDFATTGGCSKSCNTCGPTCSSN